MSKSSLYHLLIVNQQLSHDVLVKYQGCSSDVLWELLLKENYFTELDLQQFYSTVVDIRCSSLDKFNLDFELLDDLKGSHEDYFFLPLYKDQKNLYLGVSNPYKSVPKYFETNYNVIKILIPSYQIQTFYGSQQPSKLDYDFILNQAINQAVSDIHCFQRQHQLDIYFREHGSLIYKFSLFKDGNHLFIQQLKLQAHLNLTCSNKPQDGHLVFKCKDKNIDARVATLPTVFGEDAVIRLFNQPLKFRSFSDLKISLSVQYHLNTMLTFKSGLILVTGPTGSGKTTTLYTMLMQLKQQQRGVIVSLEDPVEMVIDGVRQSSINRDIGFDFSNGLKSVLRQDPDVIMIGEIRDSETAKIALEAAYTGHLVLSTLHTADVKTTLLRLHGFGLDPFLINHCLKGVVAQKLLPIHHSDSVLERQLKQESLLINTTPGQDKILDPLACLEMGDFIGVDQ